MAIVAVIMSVNFAACSDDDEEEGFAAVPPLFLLRLPDAPVVQMVENSPRQRRGIAGGGIVLLRRTV